VTLVEGVWAHRARIDELLAEHAHGWSLERMPAVDRNVLRIGAYELLWGDDVPEDVAIAEAVGMARTSRRTSRPGSSTDSWLGCWSSSPAWSASRFPRTARAGRVGP
jgi:hypothetical protein